MEKDLKNLAGVFEDYDLRSKQPDTAPTQELGGEIWYQ